MTEPAGTAVDHHADLFGAQTEHSCGVRVVNLLHDLHFEEVIPRSQTSHLPETSFERALAHLCRVRALDRSRVLAPLEVPGDAESLLDRVPGPTHQHLA
jgi:hypothetical protein